MVYDCFLVVAISMAYGAAGLLLFSLFDIKPTDEYQPILKGPLFSLGWIATIAAFYCFFWMKTGQTAGMRAWKIRVTSKDNSNPRFSQCLLRYLGSLLSLSLLGLGYALSLIRKDGASLHDLISDTQVIYSESKSFN